MTYPEQQFQIALIEWFKFALAPPARFFAVPNGGLLPGATAEQRKKAGALRLAMGLSPGFPDLCVMWPGVVAGVELKAPRPASVHLEPEQRAWGEAFIACGFPWAVCRSIDEVEAFLRSVGCPLRVRERVAA